MNIPYILYMAETEGFTDMVDTRTSHINAIINDYITLAKQGFNINDMEIQNYLNEKYNLGDMSSAERHKIAAAVEKML